jgi:hypothetical protein
MSQALDLMREELAKLPQLYPSRRCLEAAYAAMLAIERRQDDLDVLLQLSDSGKRLTDE